MTDEDIIRKGNKSELLLQDEVFTNALQQLQDIQVYKWKSSLPDESAKRVIKITRRRLARKDR